MRQHEYLVALKAENGLLTLHTLHWADELRDPKKEIDNLPGKAKASEKELKMAEQLIEALSMEWGPHPVPRQLPGESRRTHRGQESR